MCGIGVEFWLCVRHGSGCLHDISWCFVLSVNTLTVKVEHPFGRAYTRRMCVYANCVLCGLENIYKEEMHLEALYA